MYIPPRSDQVHNMIPPLTAHRAALAPCITIARRASLQRWASFSARLPSGRPHNARLSKAVPSTARSLHGLRSSAKPSLPCVRSSTAVAHVMAIPRSCLEPPLVHHCNECH